jgi:hypothetical protein
LRSRAQAPTSSQGDRSGRNRGRGLLNRRTRYAASHFSRRRLDPALRSDAPGFQAG